MRLYLTGNYQSCSYVDNNDQVLYVVETASIDRFNIISTVKRMSRNDDLGSSNDSSTNVGEFSFNRSSGSRSLVKLGGQEYETSHFFSKIGRKNDLGFTGPDSVEYKWRLGDKTLQLVRRNADKTPIALFHPKSIESPSRNPPASLEIYPQGEHMVDLIIVTYVFAQKGYDSRRVNSAWTPSSQTPLNVLNVILKLFMVMLR